MIVDKIEQTDGFRGLYGEVVTEDIYRLRSIKWQPDVILDLGANIGIFARFARTLFPNAFIISVEPNPDNIIHFKKFIDDEERVLGNLILIEEAIGIGDMWHCKGAINGAHECYLSAGLGYEKEQMIEQEGKSLERSEIPTVMPDELINYYVKEGQKSILKIDIEGGENAIFTHPASLNAMSRIDYIAMEIHWYGLTGDVLPEVRKTIMAGIEFLKKTHDCELDNVSFWAKKKDI